MINTNPFIDYSRCAPDILERFWAKVDRSGDCWEWRASKRKNGYGQFGLYAGRVMTAHRFIDIAFNGEMNPGECTLHKCDNRACVRPSHLFRGTIKDNHDDMVSKGRGKLPPPAVSGEASVFSKLSESDVKEIRRRRDAGEALKSIAKDFGIIPNHVGRIARGVAWKQVA